MTDNLQPTKRVDKARETENEIMAVYEAATQADKDAANEIAKRAIGAGFASEVLTITPAMAAILFFDHNKQNRKWDHALSQEYARQMAAGKWRASNQGIGFVDSGNVIDGQHRLAGVVLAGVPVEMTVTFGLKSDVVLVLDTGKRRPASDALDIRKTENPVRKATIVTRTYGYLAKVDPTKKLHSNEEIVETVDSHESELNQAIEIGTNAKQGVVSPILNDVDAQVVAFELLISGWPADIVKRDLTLLQLGYGSDSEDSPLFIAAKVLNKIKESRTEKASPNARIGAVIKAFQLHEAGVKSAQSKHIRDAMKPKNLPDPAYQPKAAAAE